MLVFDKNKNKKTKDNMYLAEKDSTR